MWIAKSDDGISFLCFTTKPVKKDYCWLPGEGGRCIGTLYDLDIKLEPDDAPIEMELTPMFKTREHSMVYHLQRVYDVAEVGSHWMNNDAGGCSFCKKIKEMVEPVIDQVNKDINTYNIREESIN